jgi:putative SOS response-associated peptidase YedK
MHRELHYTLTSSDEPRFNIAPGQQAPIERIRDGVRAIESMRWGLLPRWRGHGGKRGPLVNTAPLDAIAGTPLLRDALKKQRCLVLADGCFAWRGPDQPVWFHPQPPHMIGFAGVWNESDDDAVPSFAVLLGAPLVSGVQHAMPIVLGAEAIAAWLDPKLGPADAMKLAEDAPPPSGWRADAVTTRMVSAQHDDAKCIAPIGNPNQGELF